MICNSSPLICLSRINQLEILKKLFKNIIITEKVRDEILISEKPGYELLKKNIQEGWIKIMNPQTEINLNIDPGENSVINLAKEINHDLIIDDERAIKVARSLNIRVFRTTSIIIKTLNKKLINKEEAKLFLGEIIENGYYISPYYYSKLIQAIEDYKY